MFVVKKNTQVALLRKDFSLIGISTILKEKNFNRKHLYKISKCKCCDDKVYLFFDKDIPFIQVDKKDLMITQ